jgi:hypothetical protein
MVYLDRQIQLQRIIIYRLMQMYFNISRRLRTIANQNHRLVMVLKMVSLQLKLIQSNAMFKEGKNLMTNSLVRRMSMLALIHVGLRVGGIYKTKSTILALVGSALLGKGKDKNLIKGMQITSNIVIFLGSYYLARQAIEGTSRYAHTIWALISQVI